MYNPFSLIGKTILVTGASSGIGQATAIECSKLGASVVITGRNKERLEQTFLNLDASQGQNHQMLIADLTNDDSLEQFVKQLPSLDGVSSNAGVQKCQFPIKFIKDEAMNDIFDANLFSHVKLARDLHKKKKLKY